MATVLPSNQFDLQKYSEDRLNPIQIETWISVDPGDKHVGYARWRYDEVKDADETTPVGLIGVLEDWLGESSDCIQLVVCENWTLHPWQSASLGNNEFLTSQLIGAIKYLCQWKNVPYVGRFNTQGKLTYKRAPWRDWTIKDWRAVGTGKIRNSHVKDAMAHGYSYLWEWGWRPEDTALRPPPAR